MKLTSCAREQEVLDLLKSGHWPEVCDPGLRAHVDACSSCADTVLLRTAFQNANAQSKSAAPLDSANLLWWRAQLRRRNDALERVGKPVAGAHRFALLINLFAAVALVLSQVRHADRWAAWLTQVEESRVFHPGSLLSLAPNWDLSLLIPCAAALALLSGLAIYLTTEKS